MAPLERDPRRDAGGTGRVPDDELDVPLEDVEQLEEVELLSSLMIEAGSAHERLDPGEIDRVLGI